MILRRPAALAVFFASTFSGISATLAMEPLDDAALAAVAGKDGAVLEISLHWNTDEYGAPRTEIPEVERRFALRYDGRPHDWLVATDFYLYLDIPALSINSGDGPTLAEYQAMAVYDAPGKSSSLGSFDPYGTPLVELEFNEGLFLGMNNGIAITRDVLSGGDVLEYGWERNDLAPFVGVRIGDAANQPGAAGPVSGTGTGPTHLRLDGTVHFFGYGAEL
ncbi:hypothetical protein [Isoalcanivorax indicus]|uniref:hypothetical protein n=1 Tax=Isoalcanivorax indicus TaxID=2202653 RepID=UPI000DB9DE4D|nr:hypothetical protein [Isoalcanivorax indicus]